MEADFKIQEFIATKDFDQLTSAEKALVVSHISEADYILQRDIIVSAREIAEKDKAILYPSPIIKHSVYEAMTPKSEKIGILGVIVGVLSRSIPAYSIAIPVISFLFILPLMFNNPGTDNELVHSAPFKTVTDTIYITEQVPVEVEVIKEVKQLVKVPVIKYIQRKAPSISYSDKFNSTQGADISEEIQNAEERFGDQIKRIGKSASEDDRLDQFLTGIN
jgi:hypothetical protein